MNPVIGIVMKPFLKSQISNSLWKDLYVKEEFVDILTKLNATCIGIVPQGIEINRENGSDDDLSNEDDLTDDKKMHLMSQIERCDGLILQGGLSSHKYEVFMAKYAVEHNVPILGICAGFNNIARAVDTNVEYDEALAKTHDIYNAEPCHTVFIQRTGNFLSKGTAKSSVCVNSIHSMTLDTSVAFLNKKITVEAVAKDQGLWGIPRATVEAFSVKGVDFCLAVKWHPELLPEDEMTEFIFSEFVKACNRIRKVRKED